MISVRDKISHVLTERAWVRGVGIDLTLQSCCSWCYVIQPVHHVLHECVVGCPIPSSTYEHVQINHRGVGIDSFIEIMLLLVIRHPTCASCVAWMCCRPSNSIKHVWACPDLSSRRGHRFSLAIMLLFVLRHPTCGSSVAWMCCRMSDSIKHVRACPDLSFDLLGLYTFLHSLHSNFSPSRPFVLWFVPACETSLARDKYAMQSTQKAVEGATALFVCPYSSSWMISVRN